jgi:hypothetical protein
MFGLASLMNAITRLTTALTGLAETVETVNVSTRQRLLLDAPTETYEVTHATANGERTVPATEETVPTPRKRKS